MGRKQKTRTNTRLVSERNHSSIGCVSDFDIRGSSFDKMTVLQLLNWSSGVLTEHRIENPRLNAELLLARSLGLSRERLFMDLRRRVDVKEQETFETLVRRRRSGEPLQYILGHQEFWSIDLKVDPRVLIPRPETEVLVEGALRILKTLSTRGVPSVLDLGTGSGAIAISLAREARGIFLVATDISGASLDVARENARRAGVGQIHFVKGDLFGPFDPHGGKGCFDLIISNPPYISRSDMKGLAREIREHEPFVAFDGGQDGLDFYREISRQASSYLHEEGWILLELGQGQGTRISEMIAAQRAFSRPELICDLAGIERVIKAQKIRA
jgi:release factor glutamine methyltransferase